MLIAEPTKLKIQLEKSYANIGSRNNLEFINYDDPDFRKIRKTRAGFNSERLYWKIPAITLKYTREGDQKTFEVPMGEFLLEHSMGDKYFKVKPFKNNIFSGGHFHPHITSNGSICFGDIKNSYNELLVRQNYSEAVAVILNVLRNYNFKSPYQSIENFYMEFKQECEFCDEKREKCKCAKCRNCSRNYGNCGCLYHCVECDDTVLRAGMHLIEGENGANASQCRPCRTIETEEAEAEQDDGEDDEEDPDF